MENRKFKPKPLSVGIIVLAVLTSLTAVCMIIVNFSAGEFRSAPRFYLALAIAFFFLIAAIYALTTFKIITISARQWTVRKMINGKVSKSFPEGDILRISKSESAVYRSGRPVTTYTILLKNGETFKITSDSITGFGVFEDTIKKFLKK